MSIIISFLRICFNYIFPQMRISNLIGLFLPPLSRLDVHLYASRLEERRFWLRSAYPQKGADSSSILSQPVFLFYFSWILKDSIRAKCKSFSDCRNMYFNIFSRIESCVKILLFEWKQDVFLVDLSSVNLYIIVKSTGVNYDAVPVYFIRFAVEEKRGDN